MYHQRPVMIRNMFFHNYVVHFVVKELCVIKKGNVEHFL